MIQTKPKDTQVKIRLRTEMKDDFQAIADTYGMSLSSLGAFIIGSYVKNQKQVITPMMDSLGDKLTAIIKEQVKLDK